MITIGSLNLFHDFSEIHQFLSSLPLIYLYQYQGQLISINNIPVLRVIIYHDIYGNSFLDYQKIGRNMVENCDKILINSCI